MGKEKREEKQAILEKERPSTTTDDNKPLDTLSKLSYGVGGMTFLVLAGVLCSYLPLFLLEVAMIKPAHASVVLFGGRAWEAIANPICGIFVNKLDSRFGKMKPWIVCSLPFVLLSYFLIWVVPGVSNDLKFVYYIFIYCAHLTFITCYNLPYVSLTMFLSNNQQDRDSATAYRIGFSVIGIVLGNVIMSQFLAANSDSADGSFVNINVNQTLNSTLPPLERNQMEVTFIAAAGTIVGVGLVCGLIVILGTKEKKDISASKHGGEDNVWTSIKSVFSHRPFIIGLPCFQFSLLTLQVSLVLSNPMWQKILSKIGKKKTLGIGQLLIIPILTSLFFLPENNTVVAFILCYLVGAASSCLYLLPWSMMPDIIDDYIVKTGLRNDAIFYSFFQSFNKLLNGIGLGMSTLVLGFAGYETGASVQPNSVGMTMRILMSVVPICLTLVSIIFLCFFPITESIKHKNEAILANRRQQRESNKVTFEPTTEKETSEDRRRMSKEFAV
ncbi:sodium-dependent lysophosphatidylcholine symporter 1-like [Glandiceps talaboti]